MSPYNYVANNPMIFIDPNGMFIDDYTLDKKTGDVKLVSKTNDKYDQIVKTDKKGNVKKDKSGKAKVAIGNIAKGILKNGQNFKTDDQVIDVGGAGQPKLEEVNDFVTKLSEYVTVEITGAYLSNNNGINAKTTKVYIDEYQGNTLNGGGTTLFKLFRDKSLKGMNAITHFHTHLTNIGKSRDDIERPSGIAGPKGDLRFRDNNIMPNNIQNIIKGRTYFYNFLILTRTATYPTEVQAIPYTNWKK